MHVFGLILFGIIAFFWLTHGIRVGYGATRLPWLKKFSPAADADCPRISLIFAARDEEEKLPAALATLMEIDYTNLEVIAVDDRSNDTTRRILDDYAAAHPRLRVVHVTDLPSGWLGKPHALQKAYEISAGEWLLFTDADVRFRADVVRRAVTLATQHKLDHLSLLCDIEVIGFWEKLLVTFFGFVFQIATDPYRVSNPHSYFYVGIGAFQLVKRSAYEASGTHRRLALEVVDDMKLGKIVKQMGFHSGVGIAQNFVTIRWHAGIKNIVRGVTKNFFAGSQFKISVVALQLTTLFCVSILPFLALPFVHGWTLAFVLLSIMIAMGFHS